MGTQLKAKDGWYAVYTYPKAEKQAYHKLQALGTESFLPLQTVVSQWSDQKRVSEGALFPNYLFVKTTSERRFELLQIRELVRFISFEGRPVVIPEQQVAAIRQTVTQPGAIGQEVFDYKMGEKVRVQEGHLQGGQGYVVQKNGAEPLGIQVAALRQSISVDLAANCLVSLASALSSALALQALFTPYRLLPVAI
ncbi:UpxY family transcription antiterminator [Hymenobacter elongatus]|uniref:UpxY family transcription antiterminator n=1 Tax=Hymenobacter elongatus TaxID=877208 RepID=A0A4Z0PJK0_9BACT|nr:UpxY family transcription antiterminator [Hymenobacter elongatus]TGE15087.1 UpxY family transcription antiterminator [Hymenobacter elongatus]